MFGMQLALALGQHDSLQQRINSVTQNLDKGHCKHVYSCPVAHLKHCQTVHHYIVIPCARQEIEAESPGADLLGKIIQELL